MSSLLKNELKENVSVIFLFTCLFLQCLSVSLLNEEQNEGKEFSFFVFWGANVFFQLYHENKSPEEAASVLDAAFTKFPTHVNNQGRVTVLGNFFCH